MKKNRIVLDSNCLLQISPNRSEYNTIWQKIKKGEIILCVTTDILNEYEEVLTFFYSSLFARSILETIINLKYLELINVSFNWSLISSDYDDNKFVDCAVAANAECIVTNDKHFNILKTIEFPKIESITLIEFAKKVLP